MSEEQVAQNEEIVEGPFNPIEGAKEPNLNAALYMLGATARAALVNAEQHELCAASFEILAKHIGYVPPKADNAV